MTESDPTRDAVTKARDTLLFALRDGDGGSAAVARIGRKCLELMRVDGASISLIIDSSWREILYASDEVVARIEALQFTLGEGPCFEAFETRRPVLVSNLRAAAGTAWPIFAAEMLDQPVGCIFAFPLTYGAFRLGAMDLYRERPGWLSTTDIAIALQTVEIVTIALLGFTELPMHRAQVHQATGMLIAAFHISAQQALARLRGYSFATGRLVEEVADDLVTHRMEPADLDQP